MRRKQLISKYHLHQNQQMHKAARSFGGSGYKWASVVQEIIDANNITSFLDYGCGESTLRKHVMRNFAGRIKRWREYDPAIEGKHKVPNEPYELVTCTDVLEHIEPDYLDNVLIHIFSLAERAVFLVIALNPANKTLPDGRNTHLILESPNWWIEKIQAITKWRVERRLSPRAHKDLVLEIRNVDYN